MNRRYDIAVIGSGFAGSIMAMIAKRLGYSVVLIEKGQHPRMVIGESSTPLSNLLLEELANRYDLPLLSLLTKWGTWQRTYPNVACGLKRGFSFFHHQLGRERLHQLTTEDQLLVAASPHDDIADTHWFRADFDSFLVGQAQELGVHYLDHCAIERTKYNALVWTLEGSRQAERIVLEADFLIDATGPRGFLHHALGLNELPFSSYPPTSALYAHFGNVKRLGSANEYREKPTPFPVDSAALHHIFDGGWIWVLHFNNGLTSAGIAATENLAGRMQFAEGESAWRRILEELPQVKEQFEEAIPATSFRHVEQLAFQSAAVSGDGWVLLPGTAGFVDPLLSTGFALNLLGIQRLAEILEKAKPLSFAQAEFHRYSELTRAELVATADLIGGLYLNMHNFSVFRNLTMLYFAAASYSETARRLDKPELAEAFLLSSDPVFAPECKRLLSIARQDLSNAEQEGLGREIYQLIDRYDLAGLCKRPSDHCYPVRAEDLLDSAYKVGATHTEISDLLRRCGFVSTPP